MDVRQGVRVLVVGRAVALAPELLPAGDVHHGLHAQVVRNVVDARVENVRPGVSDDQRATRHLEPSLHVGTAGGALAVAPADHERGVRAGDAVRDDERGLVDVVRGAHGEDGGVAARAELVGDGFVVGRIDDHRSLGERRAGESGRGRMVVAHVDETVTRAEVGRLRAEVERRGERERGGAGLHEEAVRGPHVARHREVAVDAPVLRHDRVRRGVRDCGRPHGARRAGVAEVAAAQRKRSAELRLLLHVERAGGERGAARVGVVRAEPHRAARRARVDGDGRRAAEHLRHVRRRARRRIHRHGRRRCASSAARSKCHHCPGDSACRPHVFSPHVTFLSFVQPAMQYGTKTV